VSATPLSVSSMSALTTPIPPWTTTLPPLARARDDPPVLGLGGRPDHLIVPSERRLAQQADRGPSDRDIAGHPINGVPVPS
jgi:hypothetical protein